MVRDTDLSSEIEMLRELYLRNLQIIDDLQQQNRQFGYTINTLINEQSSQRTTNIRNASVNRNYQQNLSDTTSLIRNFFAPVDVYPTQEQIRAATRNVVYSDIVHPTNTSCPISLEPFTDSSNVTVIRHCGHIFDSEQFQSWFRVNCRCPVCRYDIREYSPSLSQNQYVFRFLLDSSNNIIEN